MIANMIPLVVSFLPFWREYLVYIFALCFLVFVGSLVHNLLRR